MGDRGRVGEGRNGGRNDAGEVETKLGYGDSGDRLNLARYRACHFRFRKYIVEGRPGPAPKSGLQRKSLLQRDRRSRTARTVAEEEVLETRRIADAKLDEVVLD